ncbi:MAG: LTA synthase family protein [Nitrospirota bacterium]|mgnify:CR=1 FL=1
MISIAKRFPPRSTLENGFVIFTALLFCLNYSKSFPLAVLNFSFLLLPGLLIFAITGQTIRALTIASTIVIATHLFARLKNLYYKNILMVSDLYVVFDPSNWDILIQYPLAGIGIAVIFALIIYFVLQNRIEKKPPLALRLAATVFGILLIVIVNFYRNDSLLLEQWSARLPRGQGTYANLIFSSQRLRYSPPQFHENDRLFLEKVSEIKKPDPKPLQKKPNIVVILQESTVNPDLFNLPNVTLPPLDMFKPNAYTHAQNLLRVHTFGGGTWLSEFSLISGLVSRDFGTMAMSVYYTVTPHLKTSLVKNLKENGYHAVILTPSNKSAYNAKSAYRDFGFDEVLQPQDLGYQASPRRNLWEIESATLLEYAKKIITRRTNKPLFLFMLTLKEHGPYSKGHPVLYNLDRAGMESGKTRQMSDYISRIETLSLATEAFSSFLLKRERPALLVYFGDHQTVSFDDPKRYNTKIANTQLLTQFVLRKNYGTHSNEAFEPLDIALLPGLILEQSDIKPNAFFSANIKMRKLCQGRLEDCPDQSLVNSYRHYIYQTLATAG